MRFGVPHFLAPARHMLTLNSNGRINSHLVVSDPYSSVAHTGSYLDLLDRPAITRFALTGNALDLDTATRSAINPVIVAGSVCIPAGAPPDVEIQHGHGMLDYVAVCTCVGDATACVLTKTETAIRVRVTRADAQADVTVDYVICKRTL
jgi:hypothetical protein